MAWGAAVGGIVQGLGKYSQWGLNNKTAKTYATSVRHLRRREYQDMVFSMKQAGLNPILATGATPGHSQPWAAAAPDMNLAAGIDAGTRLGKQKSEIKSNESTAAINTAKAATEAVQKDNALYQRANILQQYDQVKADIGKTNQETLESATRQSLYEAQAIKDGASAKEIDTRRKQLELEMKGQMGVRPISDPIGYLGNTARHVNQNYLAPMGRNAKRNLEAIASEAATSAKEFKEWLKAQQSE